MSKLNFTPQAFLIDIDNTLTNLDREITEETKSVVHALQKKIPLSVCTGRSYAAVKNYVMPLFLDKETHIMSGGSQIVKTDGEIIWSKNVPKDITKKIYYKAEELGLDCGFGEGNIFYASKKYSESVSNNPWKIESKPAESSDWKAGLIVLPKINDEIEKFLHPIKEINIIKMKRTSGAPYFDIAAKGVNKAVAAKVWAEKLNIDLSKVVAIGDSLNDLEILQVVGHGVAMDNATDEIKAVAQEVIGHANDNSVAEYLKTFL